MIVLRDDLTTANEYKDKFKVSSTNLDELMKNQRSKDDTRGLGYEQGESSSTTNQDQSSSHKESQTKPLVKQNQKSLVRQPNAHKLNGKWFSCNKFGHMARKCRNRIN